MQEITFLHIFMYKKSAFTLVELIVVITILAILSTIAFLSFQWYTSSARDSVRATDMNNLKKWLEISFTKIWRYIDPDWGIKVLNDGVQIGIQGKFWDNNLWVIGMSNVKDPLSQLPYTYYTSSNGRGYSILGLYENDLLGFASGIPTAYAASQYQSSYIKIIGSLSEYEHGIILWTGVLLNTPLQENYTLNTFDIISDAGVGKNYVTYASFFCPQGFIRVPANKEFWIPGFCVAKYEMKDGKTSGSLWATYCKSTALCTAGGGGIIPTWAVDKPIYSSPYQKPMRYIAQGDAIAACQSLGSNYHLITNKEWMAIARNIENVNSNWSSGLVGSGHIYVWNGSGSTTTSSLQASVYDGSWYINLDSIIPGISDRRTLYLNNGETIWDFAGNIREHTNKSDTIDGNWYAISSYRVSDVCNNNGWSDLSFHWIDLDTKAECKFQNNYVISEIWPKSNYNADNGMWRIIESTGSLIPQNIFVRWGSYMTSIDNLVGWSGIYSIHTNEDSSYGWSSTGFRCVYSK